MQCTTEPTIGKVDALSVFTVETSMQNTFKARKMLKILQKGILTTISLRKFYAWKNVTDPDGTMKLSKCAGREIRYLGYLMCFESEMVGPHGNL